MRNIDTGSDTIVFDITTDNTEDVLVPLMLDAAPETVTDAGAVSIATYHTNLVTTTASAVTLAAASYEGQLKSIQFITDVGDATLTIADPVDASNNVIAFADVGDSALLVANKSLLWRIVKVWNCADGSSAPAIS